MATATVEERKKIGEDYFLALEVLETTRIKKYASLSTKETKSLYSFLQSIQAKINNQQSVIVELILKEGLKTIQNKMKEAEKYRDIKEEVKI